MKDFLITAAMWLGILFAAGFIAAPFLRGEPQVPVSILQREALLGSGRVLQVRNTGGQALANVSILVKRGDEAKRFEAGSLGVDQAVEYGWAEGWAFQKGDTVTVTAAGHSAATVVFKE